MLQFLNPPRTRHPKTTLSFYLTSQTRRAIRKSNNRHSIRPGGRIQIWTRTSKSKNQANESGLFTYPSRMVQSMDKSLEPRIHASGSLICLSRRTLTVTTMFKSQSPTHPSGFDRNIRHKLKETQ